MVIKVLGPGCPKCHEVEKLIREVVTEYGVDARIEKVSDFQEIAKCGVFSTPAVVIDDNVKCLGKVPSKKEILAWMGR